MNGDQARLAHTATLGAYRYEITTRRGTANPFPLNELVADACTPAGAPLLRYRLIDLLRDLTGCSRSSAIAQVDWVRKVLASRDSRATTGVDLAWLLDPKAGGRRLTALADLLDPQRGHRPWPGFPYAPAPATPEGAPR